MIANSLDDVADHFRFVRYETVLHPASQKVAKNPPEILVAREGKERSRVGQHAHKTRKQTQVGQGLELLLHPVPLVEVPPSGAKLHLSGKPTLEIAQHGCHREVVRRVVVVDDGLGKRVLAVQSV